MRKLSTLVFLCTYGLISAPVLARHSMNPLNLIQQRQSYDFIQKVGGMRIGDPVRKNGEVWLPVECDISGTTTITIQPTVMNSSLAIKNINATVKGHSVYLVLVTTVAHGDLSASPQRPVKLGRLKPGEYSVLYGSPQSSTPLRTIQVPAD